MRAAVRPTRGGSGSGPGGWSLGRLNGGDEGRVRAGGWSADRLNGSDEGGPGGGVRS